MVRLYRLYLWRNPTRSGLLVGAIGLVMFLVALLQAQIAGLQQDVHQHIVRETVGDAQIVSLNKAGKTQNFVFDTQTKQKFDSLSFYLAYAPVLDIQAWLQHTESLPIRVVGKDYFFGKRINGLTLSPVLCDLLRLRVGDSVRLSPTPSAGKQIFIIDSIASFPLPQAESTAILPLALAQHFAQAGKEISSIQLTYKNRNPLPIKKLQRIVRTQDFTLRTWQRALPDLVQILAVLRATFGLVAGILFLLLGLGLSLVVVQNWQERLPELKRLRILGLTRLQVARMLIAELWLLLGVGVVLGALIALPALAYLMANPIALPTEIGKGLQTLGFPARLSFGFDVVVWFFPLLGGAFLGVLLSVWALVWVKKLHLKST